MKALMDNLNAIVVAVGLLALLSGIALHWSGPVASIVGGVVLILGGCWPYLARTVLMRKRS